MSLKSVFEFKMNQSCQDCIHTRPCGHRTYFLRMISDENNKNPILESTFIEPFLDQMAAGCQEYIARDKVTIEK